MYKQLSIYSVLLLVAFRLPAQTWQLSWAEEFNGTKLNTGVWNYETGNGEGGWGTNQMDYCTDRKENVDVRNGKLVISVHKEDYNGFQYTSGRINSKDKIAVKYGKIEARIKAPGGRGIGAAFWMLPQSEKYGWWPRSGEIDILETNGHETHTNYGTVHFMQWDTHQFAGKPVHSDGDITKEFHLYTIVWDENSIKWFLDDILFNEHFIKEPLDGRKPFNEDFFFIISAGVGSDFSGKQIEDKILPQTFEVDYLRVYKQVFAPQLVGAKTSADGSFLELKFNQPILPQLNTEELLLTSNGKPLRIQSVSSKYRDNFSLIVSLAEKIHKDVELVISYKGGSLQSVEKQKAAPFTDFSVVNIAPGAAPMLASAVATDNSYRIELNFTKALKLSDTLLPAEFTMTLNGKLVRPKSLLPKPGYPETLWLYLFEPLFDTSDIQISYSGTTLGSSEGGALKGFREIKVRNELPKKYLVPSRIEAEAYQQYKGILSESCNDEGGGKNIGYIDTGDWMEYEIYVKESGTYMVNYRIAAANAAGLAELYLNGKPLLQTDLPPTYNWQSWKTVASQPVFIEKGVYRLRVLAKAGGFNLNWLEILRK